MSTTRVSTRSSHLSSRRQSIKAVPGSKLRPKKVINKTNKSLQKINVNAKNKRLNVSKIDVSANNSLPLSRRLRSRNKKNYCEDSKLLQQYLSPEQQESVVILEKLNLENEKVPIYKTMKSPEKTSENKTDVYDFKFDINDSKEKTTKKKQKRKVNKQKGKTKKTTRKKLTVQSKIINNEETKFPGLDTNSSVKPTQSNSSKYMVEAIITKSTKKDKEKIELPRTDIQMVKESVNEDTVKKIESLSIDTDMQIVAELMEEETEKKIETPKINTETVGETSSSNRAFPEQIKKQNTMKPKIISIENADNITVLKSPLRNNTEEFRPFRSKNIFDNKTAVKQERNSLNCSLLTKSLSPILKTSVLDLGSPWQPSTSVFSQAKHFIQSTPKWRFENKKNMEMNKENMVINNNKKNIKINTENVEINEENIEMNKENMDMNKENMVINNKKNKRRREKEKKKKTIFHKKHNIIQEKLPINQTIEKIQTIDTNKHLQAVPARISLGEIKNLLQQKPDINDDKQETDKAHVKDDKSVTTQKDKELINFLNFSDTFDVLSETERISNFGEEVPLFMELEPSHFSKPPQHSYRRKRAVKFDFLTSDDEEEEKKENVKQKKKKKLTKFEKENEERINKWAKSINSTFEEIDEYDLLIE